VSNPASKPPPVPAWLNNIAIVVTLLLLVGNVVSNWLHPDPAGAPVTFALLAFLSLCLGYRKTLRGGDDE
jgi:hypothetical protein